MGIALVTGRPSHVLHAEHFCERLREFACTAVPIRDPSSGEIIGILDYINYLEDHRPSFMGMALQMGRCIELEVYRSRKEKSEFFRECSAQLTLDEMERGLMVVDEHDIIRRANLKAVEYLNLETDNVLNKSIDHLPIPKALKSLKKGNSDFTLHGRKLRIERKPLMHQQNRIGSLIFLENLSVSDKAHRAGLPRPKDSKDPVGTSPAFRRVLEIAGNAARCSSNVLLQGDTGTGKEVLARYIHDRSARRAKPFVAINCGSIPRELLGSELFGYEAGAFTGAGQKGHPSKFEIANGGTILLDEISEMPIDSQVYLLRVIEERTVNRLGGSRPVPVDIRIIATSNKDLQSEVEAGRFRADLLFRINVLRIDLPPLKDRKEDIALLLDHFFRLFTEAPDSGPVRMDGDALAALTAYDWPGNVRELRNTIERALAMAQGCRISSENLPEHIRKARLPSCPVRKKDQGRYHEFLNVYQEYQGNISRISKALRVSRPTVYAWRKKLGIGETG